MTNYSLRVHFVGYIDYKVAKLQTFLSAVGIDEQILKQILEVENPVVLAGLLGGLLKDHTEGVHAALFDLQKHRVDGVNVTSPTVTTAGVEWDDGGERVLVAL